MLPKSRLVAMAAAAGAVCALTASGAALAAPTPLWSKSNPPVPSAYTNTTPALSAIDVAGLQGTFLAWKGQTDDRVKYKIKLGGKWFATKELLGARTNTSPTAALFATNKGKEAVFVAWKSIVHTGLAAIKYSDGVVSKNGSINWTKPAALPFGEFSKTSTSPAVLFPANTKNARVLIAYSGPYNHVRVIIGTEAGANGRKFTWDSSSRIDYGQTTQATTNAQPALTEILQPNGDGTAYVFWKQQGGSEPIGYASTPDPAGSALNTVTSLPWTLLGNVPDSAATDGLAHTTGSPAVASADVHGDGPLLLAYKGPTGFHIRFQTLASGVWAAHQFVNGGNNTTALGPALEHGKLASVSRTTGRIYLHHYVG